MTIHAESSTDRSDPARGTLAEMLGRVLPDCQEATIRRLVETARLRIVEAGEQIYGQGDAAPLTIILVGYAAARRTTVNGKELVSGIAPSGVLIGWSGLASVPSGVELLALTECQIGQWRGSDIRALLETDPALALAAIDSMAWSLQQTVERIEGFLHQDARRRVLRILAQYRDLFFGDPVILTRAHLPGLVGTSREMTGHVLRQLEREGTVRRVGRAGLELLRPDRLDEGGGT